MYNQIGLLKSHTHYPGTLLKGVLGVYGVVEKPGKINVDDKLVVID